MATKTLPGFKTIEFADAKQVSVVSDELIHEGIEVQAFGNFQSLPIVDIAGATVKTERVNGELIYTTLVQLLVKDCGTDTRQLLHTLTTITCAFRLTDVYKNQYLLGTDAKPHPTVIPAFESATKPNGVRAFAVEIQYINTHSLLIVKN
jgi:hypothetical protein